MSVLRTLLHEILDYAGVFPPALQPMSTAVQTYTATIQSPYAWMLGRFVVTADQLDAFAATARMLLPTEQHWRISVVLSSNLATDLALIETFNQHQTNGVVDTIEFRAHQRSDLDQLRQMVPPYLSVYVELKPHALIHTLVEQLAQDGYRAKIHLGGTAGSQIPHAAEVVRFLDACVNLDVPFKAAGLEHPIRGMYLAQPGSSDLKVMMFGFMNVFLTAAFLRSGMSVTEAVDLLQDTNPKAFVFDQEAVSWRGHRLTEAALAQTRLSLAASFHSASFETSLTELQRWYLLR